MSHKDLALVRICFVFALMSVWALVGHAVDARANEISSLYLAIDGSGKPPGDRIDVSLVLYPEAKDVTLKVSAYLVAGKNNEEQTCVMAKAGSNITDEKGHFQLSVPVLRKGRIIEPFRAKFPEERTYFQCLLGSVAVPYADLFIDIGKHRLGYEVRLVVDGKVADAVPTSLTVVDVTDKTRIQIVNSSSVMVSENRIRQLEGLQWKNGALIPVRCEQVYEVRKPVYETRAFDVKIKGEYLRSQPEPATYNSRPSDKFVPERKRTVYFATNRTVANPSGTVDNRFGNEAVLAVDKMTYGSCLVSIPVDHHKPGDIEQPGTRWWFWSETPDPEKHFLVQSFTPSIGLDKFKRALGQKDVLVYVHGYDNTFKDAILRCAQINHDLEFGGQVVAFSWPSAGDELAYDHDEKVANRSQQFLATLLDQLLDRESDRGTKGKIHVIAHSMGNRILLKAIHEMTISGKPMNASRRLGQIILAAADVDGLTYANLRNELVGSCDRVNYYFASDDKALAISRIKHVDRPIGLGPVFDNEKMDTISAESLTTIFHHLGHSYVSESRSMLTDIRLILSRGLPPRDRRPPLGPRIEAADFPDCFYWTFVPEH